MPFGLRLDVHQQFAIKGINRANASMGFSGFLA
jgi:hypothetical protein